jgi:type IV secretion system protein VirB10
MSLLGVRKVPADGDAGQVAGELDDSVRGERAAALVYAVRGIQSRISSLLAAGLMITLGVAALTWYYAHALGRSTRLRQTAQTSTANRAAGEMPLPPLGPLEPAPARASAQEGQLATTSPAPVSTVPIAETSPAAAGTVQTLPPAKTPQQLEVERRLSGAVFAHQSGTDGADSAPAGIAIPAGSLQAPADTELNSRGGSAPVSHDAGYASLAGLLQPTDTDTVQARVLPTQRLLLPKGSFIDAPRHDHLRYCHGYFRRRREGRAARAGHEARR